MGIIRGIDEAPFLDGSEFYKFRDRVIVSFVR